MALQEVPRIDLSLFNTRTRAGRQKCGTAILESFVAYGFVRITGHRIGMSKPTVQNVYEEAKKYFALPEAEKLMHMSPSKDCQAGFAPFGHEHAKDSAHVDLKEFFTIGQELPWGHPVLDDKLYVRNIWPDEARGNEKFRKACLDLYREAEQLAVLILGCLSLVLVEEEEWLSSMVYYGDTKMRVIHYPSLRKCRELLPGKEIDGEIRSSPHEDINLITILPWATSEGLQILTRENEWLPIRTEGEEMVVNVGDMLSRITNNLLPSTTHRVVNPADENEHRLSIPVFIHPRPRVRLAVPKALQDRRLPFPPMILARTFLYERLVEIGNIADSGFDPTSLERE